MTGKKCKSNAREMRDFYLDKMRDVVIELGTKVCYGFIWEHEVVELKASWWHYKNQMDFWNERCYLQVKRWYSETIYIW